MGNVVIKSFSGPVKGLNTNLAPAQMTSNWALQLDNFLCRPSGLTVRDGGTPYSVNINNALGDSRLIPYNASSTAGAKMFVAATGGIYDWSSGLLSTALMVNRNTSYLNFATGAGEYVFVWNGSENALIYNGAIWAAVGIGGVAINTIVQGCAYRKRVYFLVEAGNNRGFWYLAPDAIGGAATFFNVGSLVSKGGTPVALATWSIDGGGGPDDYLILAMDTGEIIVFNGNDPGATDWKVIGTFFVGRPASRACFAKYGGDLLFLCEAGCFPLSKALKSADINRSEAITDNIAPTIQATIRGYLNSVTSISKNPPPFLYTLSSQSLVAILFRQAPTGTPNAIYVMDTRTGGWSQLTLNYVFDMCEFQGTVYAVGSSNSYPGKALVTKLFQPGTGSLENTSPWLNDSAIVMVTGYDRFGSQAPLQPLQVRPFFNSQLTFPYSIGWAQDYRAAYVMQDMSADQSNWAIIGASTWGTTFTWGNPNKVNNPWLTVAGRAGLAQSLQWTARMRYLVDSPPILATIDMRFAEQASGGP